MSEATPRPEIPGGPMSPSLLSRTKRKNGKSGAMTELRTLDLEKLQLKSGGHSATSGEMCVMEAVAYVAGEPWSDSPQCASPVIAAFLRSYNDAVDDEVRQTLKPFIPRLVGTRSTEAVEERRALVAADWLVRTHTPTWLRLAGLNEQADALASLPEITSMAQVPSIQPSLKAARRSAAAAWDAARDAAWAAAKKNMQPTVDALQAMVPALIERMLSITEAD